MKILLPLDGSDLAESAIVTTAGMARRLQAQLVLARVTAPILTTAPELLPSLGYEFAEQARAAALLYLESLQERFQGLPVETRSLLGSPKEQLSRLAAELHCDLVVMASHGRTGVARWLLGSTAEYVLRHTSCQVLLLRPDSGANSSGDFHHVLVPVDGSEASRGIISQISPYLAPGGKVTVLRASGLSARDYTLLNSPSEIDDYLRHLAEQVRRITAPGLQVEHQVIDGEAADCIVHYAEKHGCDLIAMSTHGRTGFRRFVLGSVTEKVARQAACPVLAFPHHEA